VLFSTGIATLTGAFAGYRGGIIDLLLIAILDVLLSLSWTVDHGSQFSASSGRDARAHFRPGGRFLGK